MHKIILNEYINLGFECYRLSKIVVDVLTVDYQLIELLWGQNWPVDGAHSQLISSLFGSQGILFHCTSVPYQTSSWGAVQYVLHNLLFSTCMLYDRCFLLKNILHCFFSHTNSTVMPYIRIQMGNQWILHTVHSTLVLMIVYDCTCPAQGSSGWGGRVAVSLIPGPAWLSVEVSLSKTLNPVSRLVSLVRHPSMCVWIDESNAHCR